MPHKMYRGSGIQLAPPLGTEISIFCLFFGCWKGWMIGSEDGGYLKAHGLQGLSNGKVVN